MFIRARNEEQFKERRKEIIDATEKLYKTFTFRQINFTKISQETNIARSTIYNYYLNKEEIFLDIIEFKFLDMANSVDGELGRIKIPSKDFLNKMSSILITHYDLLVLIGLYIEQIEYVCSQEKLNEFKIHLKPFVSSCFNFLSVQFPQASQEEKKFLYLEFIALLHGVVSACSPIEKQKVAMQKAGTYFEVDKKDFINFALTSIFKKYFTD